MPRTSTKEAVSVTGTINTAVETPATEAPAKPGIETIDLTACGDNKSAKIRALVSAGFKDGEIAKHLGIRYQFVNNVRRQPLPKAPRVPSAT